jgi:hypothetical protein
MSEKPKLPFWQYLQQRWALQSAWQVPVILLVFACTGFSVMALKRPVFEWLGITKESAWWLKACGYTFTLTAYQGILLAYGALFGQFRFFWNFEKKMFGRIATLFGKKNSGNF